MGEERHISTEVPAEPEDQVPAFGFDGMLSPEIKEMADTPVDPAVVEAAREGDVIAPDAPEDPDTGIESPAEEEVPVDLAISDEKAANPEEPVPGVDQDLLAVAESLGVSEQDAREAGSPEALRIAVTLADRRARDMLLQLEAQQPPPAEQPAQPQQQPVVQPAPAPQPVQQVQQPPVQQPVNGIPQQILDQAKNEHGEYDEADQWRAQQDIARYQRETQQDQYSQQQAQQNEQAQQQARQQQACADVDGLIESMGDGWVGFLGGEKTEALLTSDPYGFKAERRHQLAQAASQLQRMDPSLSKSALGNRAASLAFADQMEEVVQRRVAEQAKARSGQLLNRPSSRGQGTPRSESPDDEVFAAVSKAFHDIQTGKV